MTNMSERAPFDPHTQLLRYAKIARLATHDTSIAIMTTDAESLMNMENLTTPVIRLVAIRPPHQDVPNIDDMRYTLLFCDRPPLTNTIEEWASTCSVMDSITTPNAMCDNMTRSDMLQEIVTLADRPHMPSIAYFVTAII